MDKWRLRNDRWVDGLMIAVPLVLLAPLWLRGQALFWGTSSLQFAPWWIWAWRSLAGGELPLWNPLAGMGAPLVANYQSALFYPPVWALLALAALGGEEALAWGQTLYLALHLAWAGMGMRRVARQAGMNLLAQAMSGLAFGLAGYWVGRGSFLSIIAAGAWLPWVLLGVMRLCWQRGAIVRLSAVLGMQLLAGHAQTSWYSWLLAGFWAAVWHAGSAHSRDAAATGEGRDSRLGQLLPGWLAQAARLALAGAASLGLGLALAAVQLLPTAEYLLQSPRADQVSYAEAMLYSFWPWRLIGLLAPDFFGNPARGDFWGYATFWEDAVYIGLLPLLLAGRALLRQARTPAGRRVALPLAALIVVAFILAFGENTPVFPWLYAHVPTFDMFKAPARFSLWAVFALVFLSGLGLQGWQRPTGRALYWTRLATAAAGAVTLGGALAWFVLADAVAAYRLTTMVRATCLAGVWGLGSAVLALTAPGPDESCLRRRAWQAALLGWVTLDLLVAGWGLNPGSAADFYAGESPSAARVRTMSRGRLYLSAADERLLKFERYFEFQRLWPTSDLTYLRHSLLPNLFLLDDLPSVNQFDPLVPARYARWMEALAAADATSQQAMLRLMGVGAIERVDESQPWGVRFEAFEGGARLRWFGTAQVAADETEALSLVLAAAAPETMPALDEVLILEGADIAASSTSAQGSVTALETGNNRLTARVEANAPGWLFVADVWYPGWQAWLDGRPAPVLRADYLFRAVAVPSGTHTVMMVYRPMLFYVGAGISLASLALISTLSLSAGRRSWPAKKC